MWNKGNWHGSICTLFTCIHDVRLLTCGAINLSETGTVMVALRVFT